MSAPTPGSEGAFEESFSESDEQEPKSDDSLNRELLEQVLNKTLSDSQSSGGQGVSAMDAMLPVVRRLGDQPFSLDPVAIQLVKALLENQFQTLNTSTANWERIARNVATTLFDDPVAHDRLKDFWNRLVAEN